MPLVAIVAVGAGLVCMWKVHQLSEPEPVIAVNGPQAPEQFNPKQMTYEVFGNAGAGGMLDYVDIDGHPHRVDIPPYLGPTPKPLRSLWFRAVSRYMCAAARSGAECW
ncbi:hypothetical protein MKUB_52980 [Mycobacterium kubicae]|uniref:Uncharacterized protein n=1 Tax=Mycobacterium kubicae TaxID=120959 RepID=A0ABQ1BVP5_9MYCO|nr:hypothetical protein MKUB_52980 [Mycobacterium kubicae]